MLRNYYKGIVIPILLILSFIFVGMVDGGAEAGSFPKTENARVQIIVTLDDGNTYIVADYNDEVTFNTYGRDDRRQWHPVGSYEMDVKY